MGTVHAMLVVRSDAHLAHDPATELLHGEEVGIFENPERVARINAAHPGRDIVCVSHGGPIKAAIAHALGLDAGAGLAFTIDNCSITRLDYLSSDDHCGWRVPMINQQPWIASRAHDAMHQPAGPEIGPGGKLA